MALNSNFRTLTADNIEGIVDDRNYLKSSFENGTITGWTEVAVTLTSGLPTGTPTIGATAASSLALSASSVTPLSGSRSLLVDVPSALTAGHGFISDEFTLDRMDLGKILTVTFDYERVTGTYNFSGTLGSQTWMVYVYDATAGGANWIQPAGFLGMNQSSGPGRVRATFQSSVTAGQKYRVAVIASQAASGASSIEFDNFTCSRQTAPIGPVVTDWVTYTPTINWTGGVGTPQGRWKRVGDHIEIFAQVPITGSVTPTATSLTINIPSGLSIDTTKLAAPNNTHPLGEWAAIRQTVAYYGGIVVYNGTQNILLQINGSGSFVTNSTPNTWANTDSISVHFTAPISGWSSNVQLSNDTDTRVVAFNAYDGAQVAITNTTAVLPLGTTSVDTHAVRSGNTYVIPVSGFYRLSAKSTTKFSVGNTTFTHALIPYKNGVAQNGGDYGNADGVNSANLEFYYQAINSIFRLNAGDIIDFRYFTDYTGVATTYLKYCSIERLSGPSVVAASETVAYRGTRNAGNYVLNNATATYVPNSTSYDTHGAMNTSTGTYTVPVSGIYEAMFRVTFFTNVNGAFANAKILMAGESFDSWTAIDSTNPNYRTIVSFSSRRMNAGDTITAQVFFPSNNATFVTDSSFTNIFQIKRIGN